MDILVADDEDDIREQVCAILEDEGYKLRSCSTIAEAQAEIHKRLPSLAILDVWFKHCAQDGISLLKELQQLNPHIPVIMISGHSTVDMAVRALRIGAQDFLTKPFSLDGLVHAVERAFRETKLKKENQEMANELGHSVVFEKFNSINFQTMFKKLIPLIKTDRRLLITGETGVGKSHLVRYIHQSSLRHKAGLQWYNCADYSQNIDESTQLFGGGSENRIGKLELAHNGTIVLENIEALSIELQNQLIQFLQSKRFKTVDSLREVEVDVRVLCTSSLSATKLQETEGFMQSLYDYITLGIVAMPPLRQRGEDMPLLIANIQDRLSSKLHFSAPKISEAALNALSKHSWPNNIRELENILTRIHYAGTEIDEVMIAQTIGDEENHQTQSLNLKWDGLISQLEGNLRDAREQFETHFLRFHLEHFGGNVSQTAQSVGMDRASLHRKLRNLDIDNSSDSE